MDDTTVPSDENSTQVLADMKVTNETRCDLIYEIGRTMRKTLNDEKTDNVPEGPDPNGPETVSSLTTRPPTRLPAVQCREWTDEGSADLIASTVVLKRYELGM
ncbi:hypothetical protein NLJ89_g3254 [Agrocybe chaxingu]|uniref:Uncharacterized protein n=1 Tax=Agrocybe chaxingu TaxID=84603 RepID=A0A9W8KA54_9AGAR|nr:hypothetical protein NLJ89_g3254 [Agrocybe chaxingu]